MVIQSTPPLPTPPNPLSPRCQKSQIDTRSLLCNSQRQFSKGGGAISPHVRRCCHVICFGNTLYGHNYRKEKTLEEIARQSRRAILFWSHAILPFPSISIQLRQTEISELTVASLRLRDYIIRNWSPMFCWQSYGLLTQTLNGNDPLRLHWAVWAASLWLWECYPGDIKPPLPMNCADCDLHHRSTADVLGKTDSEYLNIYISEKLYIYLLKMSPLKKSAWSRYVQGSPVVKILFSLTLVGIPSCPETKLQPEPQSFSRGSYGFHQETGGSTCDNWPSFLLSSLHADKITSYVVLLILLILEQRGA